MKCNSVDRFGFETELIMHDINSLNGILPAKIDSKKILQAAQMSRNIKYSANLQLYKAEPILNGRRIFLKYYKTYEQAEKAVKNFIKRKEGFLKSNILEEL
jgi:hypothetical protein